VKPIPDFWQQRFQEQVTEGVGKQEGQALETVKQVIMQQLTYFPSIRGSQG